MVQRSKSILEEAAGDPVIKNIFRLVPEAENAEVAEALLQDSALRESLKTAIPKRVSWQLRIWSRVKAVAMLWLLFVISLPLSLLGMAIALAWDLKAAKSPHRRARRVPAGSKGTALVSGGNKGKALAVIRHLSKAGWRVVLVEVQTGWGCGTRFSNGVSAFYSTPRPNTDPVNYLKVIREVAAKERVKLWFPVSMAQYSVYEALASHLMPPGTFCCTTDAKMTAILNDKVKFTAFAEDLGLSVPKAFSVTSKGQLRDYNHRAKQLFGGRRFLLKSVAYESISRADLFTLPCSSEALDDYIRQYDISSERPWLLQQFLEGPEYSCYTVAYRGKIAAHVDNVAELSCLNYAHVGIQEVQQWVEQFCKATGVSGQLCFDFMYDRPGGKIYSIECNPRTSTNLMAFYNHPAFARALYEPGEIIRGKGAPLLPLPSSKPTYWIWNEIGKALFGQVQGIQDVLRLPSKLSELCRTLRAGRDAVYDVEDPLPFLALHYLQEALNLFRIVWLGTPWLKLDLCSGKVVELGGD